MYFYYMLKDRKKIYVYMLMGDYIFFLLYICLHDTFFSIKNS